MYDVICEDGQRRHFKAFTTRAEASYFAEWGHCCTRNHEIVKHDSFDYRYDPIDNDDHCGSTMFDRD